MSFLLKNKLLHNFVIFSFLKYPEAQKTSINKSRKRAYGNKTTWRKELQNYNFQFLSVLIYNGLYYTHNSAVGSQTHVGNH